MNDQYFFSASDHAALNGIASSSDPLQKNIVHTIAERLNMLQRTVSRRVFGAGSDLHACWDGSGGCAQFSYTVNTQIDGLAVAFMRSQQQATVVERMMGRGTGKSALAQAYRHPIIEMRLTPSHFAIEMIMSPYAWWDQRNFIGKMQLQRQRDILRALLQEMGDGYKIGFWSGVDLYEEHLTARQLLRGHFLEEWFSTFAAEHDWFRMGIWYEPEHALLTQDNMVIEAGRRLTTLAKLHNFVAWKSENNYHSFLNKNVSSASFSGHGL